MSEWEIAAEVAVRQHMVTAVWQLAAAGLAPRTIQRRVAESGWSTPSAGVVVWPAPDTDERRLMAAFLAYARPTAAVARPARQAGAAPAADDIVAAARDCGVVVCGDSATWLHGLSDPPDEAHIMIGAHDGRVSREGVQLRHCSIDLERTTVIQGFRVPLVNDSIMDAARVKRTSPAARHYHLIRLIRTADALRKSSADSVLADLTAAGKFRGKTALRRACLDLLGELTHSHAEGNARRLVAEVLAPFGLALHPRPLTISDGGVFVGEADLPVVALRLDIEVDGPHHDLPPQQAKDRIRDRKMRDAGWEVERFAVEFIDTRPEAFKNAVRGVVRRLVRRGSLDARHI